METQIKRFKEFAERCIAHTETYGHPNWSATFFGVRGEGDCVEIDYNKSRWSFEFIKKSEGSYTHLYVSSEAMRLPNWLTVEKFEEINGFLESRFDQFRLECDNIYAQFKADQIVRLEGWIKENQEALAKLKA
jgi:hypothetical protein